MSERLDASVLNTVCSMGKTGTVDSYRRAGAPEWTYSTASLPILSDSNFPVSKFASRSHTPVLHASSWALRSRHLVKTRDAEVLRRRYGLFL